jgi:hypothetical protein
MGIPENKASKSTPMPTTPKVRGVIFSPPETEN